MDLDFSEEQEMLRELARGVCAEHAPLAAVRAAENDPVGYPSALWKQLGELGLIGLDIPERLGGGGQSALECAILYEELGRSLAPSPHFVSSVLCGQLLARAGSDVQQKQWLPTISSGEAILTPAWIEAEGGYGPEGVQLRAEPSGAGWKLSGLKRHVCFASSAERVLVLARTGSGEREIDLFLLDPEAPGVSMTQQRSLASDAQYELRLEAAPVAAGDRVGAAGSGWDTFEEVMHYAIVMAAAQAIGGAQQALDITAEYAKQRKQFDKPLAAFQSISHYLADAATAISGGRTLVHQAAWAHAEGKPSRRLSAMAKLYACQTFRDVTAMCQQVWGGVGFTVEYDIQLYFRRAKQLQLSWWDSRHLEELIAADALD